MNNQLIHRYLGSGFDIVILTGRKLLAGLFIGCSILLFSSCEKEAIDQNQGFIKTIGGKSNSSMSYVLELPQERFLLCGKMSQPAFVGNAFNEGGVNQDVQVGGPAIALVDSKGNLIKQKIFPVEDLRLAVPVYVTDIERCRAFNPRFPYFRWGIFCPWRVSETSG